MRLKKVIIIPIVFAMILSLFPISAVASKDLVKNGTFETDLDGWKATSAKIEHYKEDAHISSGCMKVTTTAAYGLVQQSLAMKKGVAYEVTAWVRLETGSTNGQIIMSHKGEYGFVAAGTKVTTEWTKLSAIYKYSGKNKDATAAFYIQLDYNNGCPPIIYYMDDVSVISLEDDSKTYRETNIFEDEMAENIGFDNDVSGYMTKNSILTRVEEEGYNNSFACGCVTATGDYGSIGQEIIPEYGQHYKLSAAVKMKSGQSEFTYVVDNNDDTNLTEQRITYITPDVTVYDDWAVINADYIYKGTNNNKLTVYLRAGKSKTIFYVDDFSIIKGDKEELDENEFLPDNTDGTLRVASNGKIISFNVTPYLKNGVLMAPLNQLANALNAKASYDALTDNITVIKGKKTVDLVLGRNFASMSDGTAIYIQSPEMKMGILTVPVRFTAENLGAQCKYDEKNKTAIITFESGKGYLSAFNKTAFSKNAVVGYLGYEVTNGEHLTNDMLNSWRAKTTKYLKDYYGESKISEINASVSYSDIILSTYRLENDLLKYNPDLVFIEIGGNDLNNINSPYALEGIIRKIKSKNHSTDIVTIFTLNTDTAKMYAEDIMPKSLKQCVEIADYYGVATLNVGKSLALSINKDMTKLKSYVPYDSITTTAGQSSYYNTVEEFLNTEITGAKDSTNYVLKSPLYNENYENAKMITIDSFELNGFIAEDSKLWKNNKIISSLNIADSFSCKFSGSSVGIFFEAGPDTGILEYSIDGGKFIQIDTANTSGYTLNYALLNNDLKNKEHNIVIKVADSKNKYSSGYNIRVGGIMCK